MTDDRIIPLHSAARGATPAGQASQAGKGGSVGSAEYGNEKPSRLTVGVEVPADRRSVLMVQTIAQLATLAKEAGVPLDDGLAEGAERLARNLRGAGLALPPHLEDALEEIALALAPPQPQPVGGIVVPFRAGPSDD
ncbi:MAG: hypothetical protein NXI18_05815 [Alphaproteobacteria bacterium]|nr:hypothetical protein [Alphaproteobacteria bacterium]